MTAKSSRALQAQARTFAKKLGPAIEAELESRRRTFRETLARLRRYNIHEQDVVRIVGSPDGRLDDSRGPWAPLLRLRSLLHVEKLLADYRRALPLAEVLDEADGAGREAAFLRERIAILEGRCTKLRELAARVKLGKGRKWNVPPPEFWELTPDEIEDRSWTYAELERWEWIGDRLVELYRYLAKHVPPERPQQGRVTREIFYNMRAAKLTAEVLNSAWSGFPAFSRSLTARDVMNRLARRSTP